MRRFKEWIKERLGMKRSNGSTPPPDLALRKRIEREEAELRARVASLQAVVRLRGRDFAKEGEMDDE